MSIHISVLFKRGLDIREATVGGTLTCEAVSDVKIEDFQEALLRLLACRFGSISYLESLEDWIGLHSRRELQTLAYPIKTNASQLN